MLAIDEFDANLRRLPPDDTAEARRDAILHQIESIRNANRAFDDKSGALFRNITDGAIDGGPEAAKADLSPFQHASAWNAPSIRIFESFHRRPTEFSPDELNGWIKAHGACAGLAGKGEGKGAAKKRQPGLLASVEAISRNAPGKHSFPPGTAAPSGSPNSTGTSKNPAPGETPRPATGQLSKCAPKRRPSHSPADRSGL